MDYKKLQFLQEQKLEIFKRMGNPIDLALYKEYRKKLLALNEMIQQEKKC